MRPRPAATSGSTEATRAGASPIRNGSTARCRHGHSVWDLWNRGPQGAALSVDDGDLGGAFSVEADVDVERAVGEDSLRLAAGVILGDSQSEVPGVRGR